MVAAMRRILIFLVVPILLALGFLGWGWHNARAEPIVRRAAFALPDWPVGAPTIRVALLSDVHIGSLAMDATRLTRIVGQVNALHPDLVLIAGDFVEGHDPALATRYSDDFVAPLAALRAPLGVVATLGNHDQDVGPKIVRRALERAGITVLENQAVARGPLAIAGIGDASTAHDRLAPTLAAMAPLRGARVVLSHSPDVAANLPAELTLVLAGHTHCGQVVLPLLPTPPFSNYGNRYRCGIIREGTRRVVVTGGLGTSQLPVRYHAPADLWLLTLGATAR